jgi:hypothetical protein
MRLKKRLAISSVWIALIVSIPECLSAAAPASEGSAGSAIEQYTINEGTPVMFGTSVNIMRANVGEGIVGLVVASNPNPPFYGLFQGFTYVNLYMPPLPDYQYDIDEINAEKHEGGQIVPEMIWQTDPDPFFYWTLKVTGLEVLGYSIAFNEYPDEFVDVTEAYYQTPEYYLSEGKHIFYVVAKNTGGNFGRWGSYEVWVDTTRPLISDIGPTNGEIVNTARPAVQAVLFDATSGIDETTIRFTITTMLDEYTVSGDYDPDSGLVVFVPDFDIEEGPVTVRLEVSDSAGNEAIPAFWSFTVATTAPEGWVMINNDQPMTDTPIVDLTLFATDIGVTVTEMIISTDGVFDAELWQVYETTVTGYELPTVSGTHTVYVKFRDSAGNESAVYTDSILLLLSVPNTFITSSPPSITADASAEFSFTSTIPASLYQYKLDNDDWTDFSSETTALFTDLISGNHYFQVRAGIDLDNNGTIDADEIDPSPAVVSWTIGTVSPIPTEAEQPIRYYQRE